MLLKDQAKAARILTDLLAANVELFQILDSADTDFIERFKAIDPKRVEYNISMISDCLYDSSYEPKNYHLTLN